MSTKPAQLSFAALLRLVAEREIRTSLRSKPFLILTALMTVLPLLGIVGAHFLSSSSDEPLNIVVVAPDTQPAETVPGQLAALEHANLSIETVSTTDAARSSVQSGNSAAALLPDSNPDNPLGYQVFTTEEREREVVSLLSVRPPVELFDDGKEPLMLRYIVTIAFSLIFFLSATMFGQTVAQRVVQEKESRIVEILLAALPAKALVAGKLVGSTLLSFAQIVLVLSSAMLGLLLTDQVALLDLMGASMLWFVPFYVLGFLLLSSMYAAAGALISRAEDIGSATSPVMMCIVFPYVLTITFFNNVELMRVFSYIPFSAPIAMPARIFGGDALWFEPLLSLLVLLAATVAVVLLTGRIYENSVLRLGSRVKLREALAR